MSLAEVGAEARSPAGDDPTVLLIDDSRSQSARIRERLAAYRVRVEWRSCYRGAAERLRDPDAGQLVDLVLIDQAFESIPEAELLTHSEIGAGAGAEDWDVHLHQGLFILARLGQDMREGLIPAAPMMFLTHQARLDIAAQVGLAGYESKRRLLSDPYASLGSYLPRMRPAEADVDLLLDRRSGGVPTSASRRPGEAMVLVELDGHVPMQWPGEVLRASDTGPLCTQRPDRLAVWAPAGRWARACSLLAMVKSASPEDCVVLTDAMPALDRIPSDASIAVAAGRAWGAVQRGSAGYTCADLRSDRIFRMLLSGRVRRHPELRPLLDLHVLAATAHGARLMARWAHIVPVLFAGGLDGTMPEELRTDLAELAETARDAEHAVTGGFHTLDPVVRDPAEWKAGCRRYLPLAAAHSPEALAVVDRWLQANAGWESASPLRQEGLRVTAAAALRLLADDPWLPAPLLAAVLTTRLAA